MNSQYYGLKPVDKGDWFRKGQEQSFALSDRIWVSKLPKR